MYGDPQAQALGDASGGGPPPQANPFLLLLVGAGVAYAHYHFKKKHENEHGRESDEEGDDGEGEDEEDDEDEPEEFKEARVRLPRRPKMKSLPEISIEGFRRGEGRTKKPKKKRFADATTDSLIDEAAVIAGRGKKGDCYKAVKLLKGRSGLVRGTRERGLYARVARAVSRDCAHADEEVEKAVTEEVERANDVEDIFSRRGSGSTKPNVEKAVKAWLELEPGAREGDIERELQSDRDEEIEYEENLRPVKGRSSLRKTTTQHGSARAKGRTRRGRSGAAAIQVRKKSGEQFRIRKEKAKTKRGYTWRREE